VDRIPAALWPRWRFAWTPTTVYRLEALLRERAFDVAHHHLSVFSPFAFASLCLCLHLRVPVVVTFHSVWREYARALTWFDRLFGWTRRPIVLSAVSRSVADDMARVAGGQPVHVLTNGIDAEFWHPTHAPRAAAAEVRIVSVMRLARRKRPRALVELMARVLADAPAGVRVRLRIVGEGTERPYLERMIRDLGLGDVVELLGFRTREEIRDIFREADVFVLPTIEEAFGIAALEARAAGLPVVAMRSGGLPEIIRHDVEGLLAASDAELAAHLGTLVRDPAQRARIAAHNRGTPPPDRWSDVVARHLDVYALARERMA
jgi:glycosyltransferase involved in cell wall biosynthesis